MRARIGAMGIQRFQKGIYVYVGSALSGVEQRVARHLRSAKKKKWHIDHLLGKAMVLSAIVVCTSSKETECEIARALMGSSGGRVAIKRFGSTDCHCPTHLVYFGDEDPGWVSEEVARTVAMLPCAYPERTGSGRE